MSPKDGWSLQRYSPAFSTQWDNMAANSAQGTLLHMRPYMDYHADRFTDHSLVALHHGRPKALLPADITPDGVLHSHRGLTYGGWLTPMRHFDGSDMLGLFAALRRYCLENGITALDYKPVPSIYHKTPAQDDIYALWREGAVPTGCQLSCCIDLRCNPGFNTLQRRHLRKASALQPRIGPTSDIDGFWQMLRTCLAERHDARPVHTVAEMQRLMKAFPQNIHLFSAEADGHMAAGVCIYETDTTAHCQYIATTPEGRRLNMLAPLFDWLINRRFAEKRYFDFGTSNEEGGRVLNEGLLRQKNSYGGSGCAYTRWYINYLQP